VLKTTGAERARVTPRVGLWIVQFRALKAHVGGIFASCHEHFSVSQQGRRVKAAFGAGVLMRAAPRFGHWIVQFGAREGAAKTIASDDKHPAV
jgi:hypothetical protein